MTHAPHHPRDPRRLGMSRAAAADLLGTHAPNLARAVAWEPDGKRPSVHVRMLALLTAALEALPEGPAREAYLARVRELQGPPADG